MIRIPPFIVLAFMLATLTGCQSWQDDPTALMLGHMFPAARVGEPARLNPRFHYLRVTIHDSWIFMASGTPNIDAPGTTGVWYSADRVVLRFQDGRLVAAIGTPTEWRQVTLPQLPPWEVLAGETKPVSWIRTRDVMPGYRYGIRDHLLLQRIPPPSNSNLKGIDPHSLVWFEERLESTDDVTGYDNHLPPARYALDTSNTHAIVYGEQCLSPDFCFAWQRWPADQRKAP